jgi:membrane protease subunit (stomatin/prohibitin family)
MIVSSFTGMLGSSKIAALDLAANYREMGDQSKETMAEDFNRYGITLAQFFIENISVPPEVEKMIDTRSQMGVVGDMGRFMAFQTAQSIPEAAASGGAGEFMGMGAGIAMGQQMAGAMASAFSQPQGQQAQPQAPAAQQGGAGAAGATTKFCGECGQPAPAEAKFCPQCGASQSAPSCPQCGNEVSPGAKFCGECGNKLA